jgi:hypothetical protein
MAHYALLDENNIVTNVIVGKDETDTSHDWEKVYAEESGQTCKRTSFNTWGNKHKNGGTPFRYNYASIGSTFDESWGNDGAFIPPSPFPSWVLNDDCVWQAPIPKPENVEGETYYRWVEFELNWKVDTVISK